MAYQGEPGAFGEMAVRQYWPDGAVAVPCLTFEDTVVSVVDRSADHAVIPVENVVAGPVEPALAAIAAAGDSIRQIGEISLPIHQCLMALPGTDIATLRAVFSHPMAIAQCGLFLAQHPWITPVVHSDTAGAAHDVASWGNPTRGAIAAGVAAQVYGLEILAHGIQDDQNNWTRFVVVTRA